MTSNKITPIMKRETVEELAKRICKRIVRFKNLEGFTDKELYRILNKVDKILEKLPTMLDVAAPVTIFGDIHGQLGDLIRYFKIIGFPPARQCLFLGDYVDRGSHSLEVIILLFCYKIRYPASIHMTRGNHECFKMNRLYGFYEELIHKRDCRLWRRFQDTFNKIPLCALVGKKIMCMHGGISEHANNWNSFHNLKKPTRPKECDDGLAMDLMWADPTQDKCSTFALNVMRSISVIFGEVAVDEFMKKFDLDMIVRAHEVSQEGFNFMFSNKVVTVFSAPFYCGNESNCGAIMHVSSNLEVSFTVLRPRMVPAPDNRGMAAAMELNYRRMLAPSPDPNQGRHLALQLTQLQMNMIPKQRSEADKMNNTTTPPKTPPNELSSVTETPK